MYQMVEDLRQDHFLSPHQLPSVPLYLRRFDNGQFTNFMERRPLVFHHIPKTAGTSLTIHLRTLFDGQLLDAKSENTLEPLMANVRAWKCVSGHFSPGFLFSHFPASTVFTLLRDPVARALSQHRDWARKGKAESGSPAWTIDDDTRRAHELAEKCSPLDFIRSDNPIIAANTRNIFVRALVPRNEDPFTTDERLIDEAFATLRSIFWFGMQDEMDVSLMLLWYQLGVPYHSEVIGLSHNKSDSHYVVPISGSDLEAIDITNSLDRKLFCLAKEEFKRRTECFYHTAARTVISQAYNASQKYSQSTATVYAGEARFLGGWSYAEIDGVGRAFRWTLGNGPTQVIVPLCNKGHIVAVAVTLYALAAAAPGLSESVEAMLDTFSPTNKSILSRDEEIEIIFSFDLSGAFGLVDSKILTLWQQPSQIVNSIGESRAITLAVHKITCRTCYISSR